MDFDTIVIGAGAVGLAIAARLAADGADTIVLEKASAIGTGTSSRNSEVIHAGLYYPTGSLKHELCVSGRRQLYKWLQARNIPHRKTGKLIVATSTGEAAAIEALHTKGLQNDVEGLSLLTGAEAIALEPDLSCQRALLSAETGILDAHAYMLSLQGALEDSGGAIAFNTPVTKIIPHGDGQFSLETGDKDSTRITARRVVNCAGLYAHQIANTVEGQDAATLPAFTLAKGSYFSCQTRPAFSRLIYPAPVDGGLGVHVTLDLGGRMRFGPDVEWLGHADPGKIDYTVDIKRADHFYAAIRKYWPAIPDECIAPDYSGVRPKLSAKGMPAADFMIQSQSDHGIAGLVHLLGIESPGLTSSLAIADNVAQRLKD